MSRFRLRFLLQEFDLTPGEVIIGRSPECQVTIEDPLISRQHAKIVVTRDAATFVDLGSRNGSKINGRPVSGSQPLKDADRIRIGAQELVFFQVGAETRRPRETGAMLFCRRCATPFPEGARVCPHCGASLAEAREDETMSGLIVEPRRTWMLQLFGEVLERALGGGKVEDAERILRRAADEFSERAAAAPEAVDTRHLTQIADYALRLASLQKDARWVRWTLETYRATERIPATTIIDRLIEVRELPGVAAEIVNLVDQWNDRAASLNSGEIAALGRLDELARAART